MHPSFDQLLSLRERVAPEDDVAVHVRNCAECRATVESTRGIAARLRELPSQAAPPDRWLAIRTAFLAQAAARSTRRVRRPGWLLPAASAAIVLCAVLLTVGSHGPQQGTSARTPVASDAPSFSAPPQQVLVAESQRLEAVLATLPADTRVSRAGTALTVAGLEDRIRWVDYRLNMANEAGINPRQEDLLWRERVELLNSLVAVRYADARTRAF
jgi:hypothetical protein